MSSMKLHNQTFLKEGLHPLSEMFGYVTSLRTLSSGRATSTMEFSHYAETPSNISESVISEIRGNTQEE